MHLPLDVVVGGGQRVDGVGQERGQRRAAALGGQGGDTRPDHQPRLQDAAGDGQVELAAAYEQARQQVQAGGPLEVADRGRPALTDLDQPGLRHPLERLAHRRPGDAQHLGQPALARQRLAGLDPAVDDLGKDLVEDLVGDGAAGDGLQRHAEDGSPAWFGGQVV